LLSLEDIRAGVPVFRRFYRETEQMYPDVIEKLKFNEALKRMLDRFVSDLIRNTSERVEESKVRALNDVRNFPQRLSCFSPPVEKELREAKKFLYSNLYFSSVLEPEKEDAERIIRELFAFWMEKPEALPHSYQEKARQEPLPRVVCDYIAGMTDNFIYDQYEKFCGGKSSNSPGNTLQPRSG